MPTNKNKIYQTIITKSPAREWQNTNPMDLVMLVREANINAVEEDIYTALEAAGYRWTGAAWISTEATNVSG